MNSMTAKTVITKEEADFKIKDVAYDDMHLPTEVDQLDGSRVAKRKLSSYCEAVAERSLRIRRLGHLQRKLDD